MWLSRAASRRCVSNRAGSSGQAVTGGGDRQRWCFCRCRPSYHGALTAAILSHTIRYRMDDRLGKDDWLRGARLALLREGPNGVRVEPLARELGVTKGSFYWHFHDREDLLE